MKTFIDCCKVIANETGLDINSETFAIISSSTYTKMIAELYSKEQNSELLDKVRSLENRIHELENPFHDLRS